MCTNQPNRGFIPALSRLKFPTNRILLHFIVLYYGLEVPDALFAFEKCQRRSDPLWSVSCYSEIGKVSVINKQGRKNTDSSFFFYDEIR